MCGCGVETHIRNSFGIKIGGEILLCWNSNNTKHGDLLCGLLGLLDGCLT